MIAVLEYFRLCRQPRTISQISGDLGYPQSSAPVLLKTLVTLGYLSFDRSSNVYFPTPKVTSLGDWVPRSYQNREGRERMFWWRRKAV